MKNKKGAISLFALVAMLFFLVFVTVAYNNVTAKSRTQVETTEVLVDVYKSDTNIDDIYNQLLDGNMTAAKVKTALQNQEFTKEANKGKYMSVDGKLYKIP